MGILIKRLFFAGILLILTTCCLVTLSPSTKKPQSQASAASPSLHFNTTEFNGVPWGIKLTSGGFKREPGGKGSWKFYSRPADHSRIEGIQVQELTYTATKGRFTAAHFIFHGAGDLQRVRDLMTRMFGQSTRDAAGREIYRREEGPRFISGMLQYSDGSGLANFYGGEKNKKIPYKLIFCVDIKS